MWEVKYIQKGIEHDFRRVDCEMYIRARDYFKIGGLYYFRIDEFNYKVIADEDIIYMVEL